MLHHEVEERLKRKSNGRGDLKYLLLALRFLSIFFSLSFCFPLKAVNSWVNKTTFVLVLRRLC